MFARNTLMRRTTNISLLVLAAISLLAASASAAVAPRFQATVVPARYLPLVMKPRMLQIAYISDRDGKDEIYLMNANGSEQTNLTNNPATDREPRR